MPRNCAHLVSNNIVSVTTVPCLFPALPAGMFAWRAPRARCAPRRAGAAQCRVWTALFAALLYFSTPSAAGLPSVATQPTACSCPHDSPPSLACPFAFYHVPKAAGSSLRHVFYTAAKKHNLTTFVPCYDELPCEIVEDRLVNVVACFERQPRNGFDEDDMRTCMTKDAWDWALPTSKKKGVKAGDAIQLVRSVLRQLSCSSVVAAHITPHTMARASRAFRALDATPTAADLGLCRGQDVACQTCWTAVREPVSRALSHINFFVPDLMERLGRTDTASILTHIGGNIQTDYITPAALEQCNVLVYEELARSGSLPKTLPWLGTTQLPALNARPVSDRKRKAGIDALKRKGIRQALRADVRLYERVVGGETWRRSERQV